MCSITMQPTSWPVGLRIAGTTDGAWTSPRNLFRSLKTVGRARCRCRRTRFTSILPTIWLGKPTTGDPPRPRAQGRRVYHRGGKIGRRAVRPPVRRPLSHLRAAQTLCRAGKGTLFETPQLAKAIEEIYRFPLRQSATDTLNRQLRAGIVDDKFAELVMALRDDDRLCIVHAEEQSGEPQIICSLGLAPDENTKT
jgi:hypothetical protein